MTDATETKAKEATETAIDAAVAVAKAPARAAEKAIKATDKAAKSAKPARRKTKARKAKPRKTAPAAKRAATKIERNPTMTFDANKLFANFGTLPGADKFQALFADAGERSQELVRKSQANAEELAELAKANVEALTEAGRIAASGARTIGQDVLASGRDNLEQASAAVKSLAEAKSPTEFFQLQAELVRASFDRAVAEGSKLTEQLVKLAGETVQPLSTRASLNAERFNEIAA